jgi:hypothetical protein
MVVLIGLQTKPLNYSRSFICRLHSSVLQSLGYKTVLSLTVLTIHSFVDSLVPRWFPCCLVLCFRTNCLAGWLTDSLSLRRLDRRLSSSPAGPLTLCRLARWLFASLTGSCTLRNSCLKVGKCGQYSRHLASPFIYAVYGFGYWWNACSSNRCLYSDWFAVFVTVDIPFRRCFGDYSVVYERWNS